MHITAGIRNEGTTWYINSLLQTLFIIAPLRKAVFKMPSDEHNTIPLCLQRIFYNLQFSKESVRISDLLRSFGWKTHEANIQHDVMEFNCILSDKLEKKMEKIPELKGTYSRIFEGEFVNFCEWIHVDFKSNSKEKFNCLQLNVQGLGGIKESLQNYVKWEMLEGDNMYDAGDFGKQEARKGIRFVYLPPVLQLQLKRFDYNPKTGNMMKINERFDIDEVLDLDDLLEFDENKNKDIKNQYHLHSIVMHRGSANAGHYFAYIRNSATKRRWLEFNDENVYLRQKKFALDMSMGGNYSDFRVLDKIHLYDRK